MTDRRHERLTSAGAARRELILAEATTALIGRTRRRRARRRALVAVVICLAGAAAAQTFWTTPAPGPAPGHAPGHAPGQEHPGAPRKPRIVVVSGSDLGGRVRSIGDDELLDLLAEIDRPVGLIRQGAAARLTGPVTDEDLALH